MVEQYWGSLAIARRLGYQSRNQIPHLIRKKGLPAFLRRRPGQAHRCLYSDSNLIDKWLFSLSADYRERLIQAREAREEQRAYALTPEGKRIARENGSK